MKPLSPAPSIPAPAPDLPLDLVLNGTSGHAVISSRWTLADFLRPPRTHRHAPRL